MTANTCALHISPDLAASVASEVLSMLKWFIPDVVKRHLDFLIRGFRFTLTRGEQSVLAIVITRKKAN